jgi:hypothetical protein
VEGASHTNLLFDVVVPARFRLTDEALRERYAGAVETLEGGTFYSVVTIDRSYLASVE